MKMQKIIKLCSLAFSASAIVALILNIIFHETTLLSIAITLFTTSYHFLMRLLVGTVYNAVFNNQMNYNRWWFQQKSWERDIFRFLKVKNWKSKMPAYDPSLFDPKLHSWEEIAMATCQAELVHETIVILSFLPIVASIWFGVFPVFLITSILSALMDLIFVIMQRYNRPRIMRIINLLLDK